MEEKKYLKDLLKFLEIPSVSTQPKYLKNMEAARKELLNIFASLGFNAQILEGEKHGAVFAERIEGKDLPTVLIYGHYDVQPPEPDNEWITEPFKPTVKDGKVFGRGTTDNKGQLFTHVMAVKKILEEKSKLPVNFKFLIEGEEEIGSPSIKKFTKTYKNLLSCDYFIVSDSHMKEPGQPTINVGLRGLLYTEVFLETHKSDLHSGQFGGVAQNPAHILSQIIANLKDETGKVKVPGFYKSVKEDSVKIPVTEEERKLWFEPSLDVNGLTAGYQGEGAKTIIPAVASAKISMRLVSGQEPHDIFISYEKYLKTLVPKGTDIKVVKHSESLPYRVSPAEGVFGKIENSLYKVFGKKPIYEASGGSIGAVAAISKELNVPCVMVGFGLPDENLHAPNEHFSLENYFKGIETMTDFYNSLTSIDK